MSTPHTARPRSSNRKIVLATAAGQVIEWLDWTLYAIFAPFFAAQFFDASGPAGGLLAAFGVYAIGFFFRPLGGVVFGYLTDRFGRARIFLVTIIMMTLGSFMIAALPTAATIGLAAPALLLVARIIQGLSAGGEMPAATALLTEAVPARRRAFYSSVIYVGIGSGVLGANILGWVLTSTLGDAGVQEFGWRIAFVIGGVVGLAGLLLRRTLHVEEPQHIRVQRDAGEARAAGMGSNLKSLYRTRTRTMLLLMGATIGGTVPFYTITVYTPTYLSKQEGMASSSAFMVSCLALALFSVLPPLFGQLADRFGRRPVMGFSALTMAVVLVPAAAIMEPTLAVALPILLFLVILLAGSSGPYPALSSELFSPETRGLGIGITYSLVTAAFGGTATYVATWLVSLGHPLWFFAYVAGTSLVAALCIWALPETSEGLRERSGVLTRGANRR